MLTHKGLFVGFQQAIKLLGPELPDVWLQQILAEWQNNQNHSANDKLPEAP